MCVGKQVCLCTSMNVCERERGISYITRARCPCLLLSWLQEGRYVNLKAIQDDMILLVKNAHHFNQPGSPVYRAASSLRKFIISRCAELERRFQTVKKTQ